MAATMYCKLSREFNIHLNTQEMKNEHFTKFYREPYSFYQPRMRLPVYWAAIAIVC